MSDDLNQGVNEQPQTDKRPMKKDTLLWALVGLAVLGLAGLGSFVAYQNSQLKQVSTSMDKLGAKLEDLSQKTSLPAQNSTTSPAENPQQVKAAEEFQTLAQKMADKIQFAHLCKGQTKEVYLFGDERRPVSYCLGENRLVMIEKSAEPKVLQTQNITEDSNAPILIKAETVPSSTIILISYAPEPCTTIGDCGAGQPTNYVTLAYDQKAGQLKPITKYPTDGTPIWNAAGTKAIFIPDTCGGAGCQIIPLIGYDVTRDATQSATTDKAVGAKDGQARDVAGKPLPRWGMVKWTSDSDFTAEIVQVDGKITAINGKF
jgi:hypothetical protein